MDLEEIISRNLSWIKLVSDRVVSVNMMNLRTVKLRVS